jgi:mono/diheme cytochrome c family protein
MLSVGMSRWAVLVALLLLAACRDGIAGGRADGPAIFSEVCARCHGPFWEPDAANVARLGVKPLTSDNVQRHLTDDDIRRQILRGSENKQMPSFAGALSDEQIAAVIAHVRTLGGRPPAAAARKSDSD